jgi:methionyl-tRNA formyltransferase
LKAWFFGSGNFAALCFREIAGSVPFERVITLPPTIAGRGKHLQPTPLDLQAQILDFDPLHSEKPSSDPVLLHDLENDPPDLALVVDFSRLIKEPLLNGPRFGCFNIHPSLLPAYRGAAPIQRALMDGRTITGVTLFRLVQTMDAGPVVAQATTPIGRDATAGELTENLALIGSQIFLKSLECICGGYAEYIAQNEGEATFAPKLDKGEERICWGEPSDRLHNRVRALNPSPGAYCMDSGKRLKIWRTVPIEGISALPGTIAGFQEGFPVVACASGALVLLEVQQEGRKPSKGDDWCRGSRVKEGDILE